MFFNNLFISTGFTIRCLRLGFVNISSSAFSHVWLVTRTGLIVVVKPVVLITSGWEISRSDTSPVLFLKFTFLFYFGTEARTSISFVISKSLFSLKDFLFVFYYSPFSLTDFYLSSIKVKIASIDTYVLI